MTTYNILQGGQVVDSVEGVAGLADYWLCRDGGTYDLDYNDDEDDGEDHCWRATHTRGGYGHKPADANFVCYAKTEEEAIAIFLDVIYERFSRCDNPGFDYEEASE